MFDLSQIGLPCSVEAHGKKWVALYLVRATDEHEFYLACPENAEMPASCSFIKVDRVKSR